MKTTRVTTSFIFIILCLASCNLKKGMDSRSDEIAMLMALEWQEAHPIQSSSPTDWTNGAYYTGVFKAHQATQDDKYLDALVEMGKRNAWHPADRFYHADDLAICAPYVYLKSIKVSDVDLVPTDNIIREHLQKPYRWKEGNENSNQPILWWWCDALFMTPPLLTMYAKYTNDTVCLNEMHTYYMQTYNLLFDKEEKLFARDLRYVWHGDDRDLREENGEKIFWSRGNGWVLGGLALVLEEMPKDYENRPFYEQLFKTMAKRVCELQHEDGLWRTSLLSPESYKHGEVSGSGFFTYAISWGINNGILDEKVYKPCVVKAWKALRACQKEDGMIGWVQNIGDSPKPVNADSWQNYGTGAFLLAGSEVIKLSECM